MNSEFEPKEESNSLSMNLDLKSRRTSRGNKEHENKENFEEDGDDNCSRERNDLRSSLQSNSFKQLLHNIHRGGGNGNNSTVLPSTPKAILQKISAQTVREIPQPKIAVSKNSQLKKISKAPKNNEEYLADL